MLTRAANPSRNEGNSLAAGIKHSSCDDVIVQLIGEILDQNEGSRDRTVLDHRVVTRYIVSSLIPHFGLKF